MICDRATALRACFEAFGDKCQTLPDFCQRIQGLFDDKAAQSQHVILATIHRAKGDEADRVFLLKSDCMPTVSLAENSWQRRQEWNLLYVGLTRSRHTLFLVPMPKQGEDLLQLLEHPFGGIEVSGAPQTKPAPQQDPPTLESSPDFELEVEEIHRVTHKFLMDFLEVAQFFEAGYPDQMQVVWQMLRTDPTLVQSEIPVTLALPKEISLPKLQAPRNRAGPLLRVGDICRYRGPKGAMNVTCQGRDLKVIAVQGEVATVDALPNYFYKHGWIHPYDIETRYLRKAQ